LGGFKESKQKGGARVTLMWEKKKKKKKPPPKWNLWLKKKGRRKGWYYGKKKVWPEKRDKFFKKSLSQMTGRGNKKRTDAGTPFSGGKDISKGKRGGGFPVFLELWQFFNRIWGGKRTRNW